MNQHLALYTYEAWLLSSAAIVALHKAKYGAAAKMNCVCGVVR